MYTGHYPFTVAEGPSVHEGWLKCVQSALRVPREWYLAVLMCIEWNLIG